jgi:alcohol dehydrogenase (NADP+)
MNEATQQIALQEKSVSQTGKTYMARAYEAQSPASGMARFTIRRRLPRPQDVQIDILYCGVCHSDLHQVRNQWQDVMPTVYPCVPGHEIVGRVVKTGSAVKKFKEGDIAAVGCMVDSCRTCASCRAGEEQYCDAFPTLGGVTYGGYSESIVVDEAFVVRVSNKLNLAGAAPLLCAGITTSSPLRHWNVGKGQKVGVVGLGGLGHMGVKFASAFGANVVLFTTSPNNIADALRVGDDVDLFKRDGTLTMVGAPEQPLPVAVFGLLMKRRQLAGSSIGGTRETQEMLDFCAEHGITADVEPIRIEQINEAYERLLKSDVKYRFVIDMAWLK